MDNLSSDYKYSSADASWSNHYLWRPLVKILTSRLPTGARILDVGCGSGATSGMLANLGFHVTGVDPSSSGISLATEAYSQVKFAQRSAYDDLAAEFGLFDAVVSLEVVEHCFSPRIFASTVFTAVKPGGFALISTPFHGYWKNLALALAGELDRHWSPLWDGGHIKFWSERSLGTLLVEAGFRDLEFVRVGRIPPLAKTMLVRAQKHEAGKITHSEPVPFGRG